MLKVIAFDFDGTLADSVDFCLEVFDIVFARYAGEKAPCREDIYQHFGMNEAGVLRYFFGKPFPEAEKDFYTLHRELHSKMCPDVFPGCRALLDFLREKEIKLAILTGRSETTCNISMEVLGLSDYFVSFQYGSPEKNDKAAQLRNLMQQYSLQPDEIVYIGDAVSDAESSHAAGVKCLSAAWAKSARIAELEKINPGLVFTSVTAMQEYLAAEFLK